MLTRTAYLHRQRTEDDFGDSPMRQPQGVTFPVEAPYVGSHTQQECIYGYLHRDQLGKTGDSLTAA